MRDDAPRVMGRNDNVTSPIDGGSTARSHMSQCVGSLVLTLAALLVMGCGSGSGGDAASGPILLVTDTLTTTPATIAYRATGSAVSSVSGARSISGTVTIGPGALFSVGGVLSQCTSEVADLSVGSTTTSSYTVRDQIINRVMSTGETLSDGTTLYYQGTPYSGPLTYAVGDSYSVAGIFLGRIEGTAVVRQEVTDPFFTVEAIANATVPIGVYECYVISHGRTTFDRLTGVTTQISATTYVRPELGVMLSTTTGVSTDGIEIVTLTLVLEATSLQ